MVLATVLALVAAVLHAAWNLLIKTAEERDLAAWGQFVFGGVVLLPVLVVTGLPSVEAVPFLAASAVVHVFYVRALVAAYHHGDFSLAYPLARGGGALTAAVLGVIALGDGLGLDGWLALLVVTVGPRIAHPAGRAAFRGDLRPAHRRPDRCLHRHRRGGCAPHRQRVRLRRDGHRGERRRAVARRTGSRTRAGVRRRRCDARGRGTWCPGPAWPPPTRWCSSRCDSRLSATSRRCASRRSCSEPGWVGCS